MDEEVVKKIYRIFDAREIKEAEILMRYLFRRHGMLLAQYTFEKVNSVYFTEHDHFSGDMPPSKCPNCNRYTVERIIEDGYTDYRCPCGWTGRSSS